MFKSINIEKSISEERVNLEYTHSDYIAGWFVKIFIPVAIIALVLSHDSLKGDLISSIIVGILTLGFIMLIFSLSKYSGKMIRIKGTSLSENRERIIAICNKFQWRILVNDNYGVFAEGDLATLKKFIALYDGNDILISAFRESLNCSIVFQSEQQIKYFLEEWEQNAA